MCHASPTRLLRAPHQGIRRIKNLQGPVQVWGYLGELTEHQASLISERFKYTDRQLQRMGGPAPGSRRLERRGPDAESVAPSDPEDEPAG